MRTRGRPPARSYYDAIESQYVNADGFRKDDKQSVTEHSSAETFFSDISKLPPIRYAYYSEGWCILEQAQMRNSMKESALLGLCENLFTNVARRPNFADQTVAQIHRTPRELDERDSASYVGISGSSGFLVFIATSGPFNLHTPSLKTGKHEILPIATGDVVMLASSRSYGIEWTSGTKTLLWCSVGDIATTRLLEGIGKLRVLQTTQATRLLEPCAEGNPKQRKKQKKQDKQEIPDVFKSVFEEPFTGVY